TEDVTGVRPERLTRLGLNYVPQLGNVFPSLSIGENLLVGSVSLPRAERRPAVDDMYAQFPLLAERRRQRAGTLSGGQRKLLAIARALVTRPRALLLDEPSAGLSPQAVELVFDQLAEVKRRGIAIVMVEQNARRALSLADRGYVLDMGRNAYEGTGRSLLDDPKVTDLYLGSTIASSSTSTSAPSGINPPPEYGVLAGSTPVNASACARAASFQSHSGASSRRVRTTSSRAAPSSAAAASAFWIAAWVCRNESPGCRTRPSASGAVPLTAMCGPYRTARE